MRTTLANSAPALNLSGTYVAEWVTDTSTEWIAPVHLHHECEEAWYVLSGRMAFKIGDDEITAEPGDFVRVPKGVPHSFRGEGVESRYLIFMTEKIKTLIDRLHEGGRSWEEVGALFREFDSELC